MAKSQQANRHLFTARVNNHKNFQLRSLEETWTLGASYGRDLPPNSILALKGALGSGKTSFVQGIAKGLGIRDPIQSPTFTYLHLFYEGRLPLYHFDLYRMRAPADFFSMGFDEYFDAGGIVAIEWPERLDPHLPIHATLLEFAYEGSGRVVRW